MQFDVSNGQWVLKAHLVMSKQKKSMNRSVRKDLLPDSSVLFHCDNTRASPLHQSHQTTKQESKHRSAMATFKETFSSFAKNNIKLSMFAGKREEAKMKLASFQLETLTNSTVGKKRGKTQNRFSYFCPPLRSG